MTEAEAGSSPQTLVSQIRTRGARPARLAADPEVRLLPTSVFAASGPVQTVTVLPATVNLEIYEGDDFYLDVYVTDMANNPVDVTNLAPMSQIRITTADTSILASIGIIVDATITNLIHLHLAAQDSNNLPANCVWDIQLSTPNVTTLASGTVKVTPQVTQ